MGFDLPDAPSYLVKPHPIGIVWMGMPKVYEAHCATEDGYFTFGGDESRRTTMTIRLLSYAWWPQDKYGNPAVEIVFLDNWNHVSTLLLRGDSYINFSALTYEAMTSGRDGKPLDLRGVLIDLTFGARVAQVNGRDKSYFPVTFEPVGYLTEQEYREVMAFINSGVCPLIGE